MEVAMVSRHVSYSPEKLSQFAPCVTAQGFNLALRRTSKLKTRDKTPIGSNTPNNRQNFMTYIKEGRSHQISEVKFPEIV
jgi:hypothetical protein